LENNFTISLLNQVEDLDGDGIEDFYDQDDDNDTFADAVEIAYGSNPRDPSSVANAAPQNIILSNTSFMENMPRGFIIGQLSATDPDINNTLSFSLILGNGSTDNHLFQIDRNNSLRTAALFRFEEEKNTFKLLIRTTDEHNAYFQKPFTLQLVKDPGQHPRLGTTVASIDPNGRVSLSTPLAYEGNSTLPEFKYLVSKTEDFSIVSDTTPALLENNAFKASIFTLENNTTYYARLETIFKGKSLISLSTQFQTPPLIVYWWESDSSENQAGWRKSDWFGTYLPHKSGWIYHQSMGWLYAHPGSEDDFWLWSQEYRWIWTKNGIYPFLYRNNTANWLYILGVKDGKAVIHDYSDGKIE
jgi:hypothetical protein